MDGSDEDCPLAGTVSWDATDLRTEGEPVAVMDVDGWVDLALQTYPHAIYFEAPGGTVTEPDLTFDPYAFLLDAGFDANGDGLGELVFHDNLGFYLFAGR